MLGYTDNPSDDRMSASENGLYYVIYPSGSLGVGFRIKDLPFTLIRTNGVHAPYAICLQEFRGVEDKFIQLLNYNFSISSFKVMVLAVEAKNSKVYSAWVALFLIPNVTP